MFQSIYINSIKSTIFFIFIYKQNRDFSIRSDGRFFRITFRSNDRLDGTGFRAQYQFIAESTTTEMVPLVMDSTANSFKSNKFKFLFK